MDNHNEVSSVVSKVWGAHVRFVGDEFLEQIQYAADSGKSVEEIIVTAKGGDSFDWVETLKILYQAVVFTTAVLKLRDELKKALGREPNKEQLTEKVDQSGLVNADISKAVASKADAVVQQIGK